MRKELYRRISGLPESCWGKSEEISFPVKILDMGVDIFQAWFSMYMQSEVESYYVGYVYWKVVVRYVVLLLWSYTKILTTRYMYKCHPYLSRKLACFLACSSFRIFILKTEEECRIQKRGKRWG